MRNWLLIGLLILALGLAACGGDDDGGSDSSSSGDVTEEASADTDSTFDPGAAGPDLAIGAAPGASGESGAALPGCSDPDDDACPAPLQMDLDGEAAADGITITYPARYFNATTGGEGAVIQISPSENNKFDERATFVVYFAESVETVLSELENPEVVEWQTGTLSGTLAVAKDQAQDPPVNTTIGAFPLEDGRVIVFKLVSTGKYGWDLYSQLYADMLESLTVTG